MRILVVSAHYPPNFVSGGTLQPQRLAAGLRARGHDVSVYAGWLGDRPPYVAWDEDDDDGMAVRWISTAAFVGWSLRENYDNPVVRDDFARHLAKVRPDVVHLHSLQSLGASLVVAAKEAGARVVLTMHDFWWFCARQFLVDRSMHPCSLVVSCGECECEVTRPWLEQRNEHLASMLAHVDLVLAPGRSAAEVFLANGVDPQRLEVDENGVVEMLTRVDPIASDGIVRFAYAGGNQEMKGLVVLLEGLQQLHGLGGWRIEMFGVFEDSTLPVELATLPIRASAPFAPRQLGEVLRRTDVLVVPSLMRESFSLLTREALQAGVPVITTDCLGPEEVVSDGLNGLVVAAADPVALGLGMRRMVEERGLLARLRRGTSEVPVECRPLADQIEQLDRRFERIVRSSPRRDAAHVRRVAFVVGIGGAPMRYRAALPAEALRTMGIETSIHHYRDRAARHAALRADVVVVYRVPATLQISELLSQLREHEVPAIFDVDDLIFDPELAAEIPALRILPPSERDLWMQGVRRYRTTMEQCVGFVGSTPALAAHAQTVTGLPTAVFGNGVGTELARASARARQRPRNAGRLRVGYFSGTNTHDADWAMVEEAVTSVVAQRDGVELWLGGHLPETSRIDALGRRAVRLPYLHWTDLPLALHDVDVNLAPIDMASPFNQAKSAIKWLEAALVGTPTVASPTRPFADAIDDGTSGLLATSPDEWRRSIGTLLDDQHLRERVGRTANRRALVEYSPHRQALRYEAILANATTWLAARAPRHTTWEPVELDEPWLSAPGDAFDPAGVGRHYDEWRNAVTTDGPVRWFGRRRRADGAPTAGRRP